MITVNSVNTKELLNSEADGEDVPAIAAALRKGKGRYASSDSKGHDDYIWAARLSWYQEHVNNSMWALWVPAMEENIYNIYILYIYAPIINRGKMEEAEDVPSSPERKYLCRVQAAYLCWLLDPNPSEGIHCSHCAPGWWDWKVGSPSVFYPQEIKDLWMKFQGRVQKWTGQTGTVHVHLRQVVRSTFSGALKPHLWHLAERDTHVETVGWRHTVRMFFFALLCCTCHFPHSGVQAYESTSSLWVAYESLQPHCKSVWLQPFLRFSQILVCLPDILSCCHAISHGFHFALVDGSDSDCYASPRWWVAPWESSSGWVSHALILSQLVVSMVPQTGLPVGFYLRKKNWTRWWARWA